MLRDMDRRLHRFDGTDVVFWHLGPRMNSIALDAKRRAVRERLKAMAKAERLKVLAKVRLLMAEAQVQDTDSR